IPAWVSANLTAGQQTVLTTYGNTHWLTVNSAKMINQVTRSNIFNIAVASPGDPRPVIRERWQSGTTMTLQGAFIRLAANWSSLSRVYTNCFNYEKSRFSLPSTSAYVYKYVLPGIYYSYQERFWYQQERPSADFFAGSQAVWQELAASNYNFTYHVP
ncbi:MAG: hypothetical protein Q8N85_03015, partial [Candidatus Omnitrophota bacterium]|nr:hypothetical protein [Candidatus Omnitrophota bacterium]